MSASRSRSSRSVRSSKKASQALQSARAPWIRNGVDFGPARAALEDLATWALDLAERVVVDWPAARAHVRKARRYVEAQISGRRARLVSPDDLMFTALLLARILDGDLDVEQSDALTIFEILNLPLDAVPLSSVPRQSGRASTWLDELLRYAVPVEPDPNPTAPPRLRFCDECGYVHEPGAHVGHRNAA